MKRMSFVLIFLMVVLAGCQEEELTIAKETKRSDMADGAKAFVDQIRGKNGVYLYSSVGKRQYVILNNRNVVQGAKASYVESVQPDVNGDTLTINFEEKDTDDYWDERVGKLRIFELSEDIPFERIQVYRNGEKKSFDQVGG